VGGGGKLRSGLHSPGKDRAAPTEHERSSKTVPLSRRRSAGGPLSEDREGQDVEVLGAESTGGYAVGLGAESTGG